jgi:hypothetical protein
LGGPASCDAVKPRLLDHLAGQFGLRLHAAPPPQFALPASQAA